jgi:hypothetical protein
MIFVARSVGNRSARAVDLSEHGARGYWGFLAFVILKLSEICMVRNSRRGNHVRRYTKDPFLLAYRVLRAGARVHNSPTGFRVTGSISESQESLLVYVRLILMDLKIIQCT